MWNNFLDLYLDEKNPIPDIGQFRIYLKDEIEKRIAQLPAVDDVCLDEHDETPKVAMIQFAYNNSRIIN